MTIDNMPKTPGLPTGVINYAALIPQDLAWRMTAHLLAETTSLIHRPAGEYLKHIHTGNYNRQPWEHAAEAAIKAAEDGTDQGRKLAATRQRALDTLYRSAIRQGIIDDVLERPLFRQNGPHASAIITKLVEALPAEMAAVIESEKEDISRQLHRQGRDVFIGAKEKYHPQSPHDAFVEKEEEDDYLLAPDKALRILGKAFPKKERAELSVWVKDGIRYLTQRAASWNRENGDEWFQGFAALCLANGQKNAVAFAGKIEQLVEQRQKNYWSARALEEAPGVDGTVKIASFAARRAALHPAVKQAGWRQRESVPLQEGGIVAQAWVADRPLYNQDLMAAGIDAHCFGREQGTDRVVVWGNGIDRLRNLGIRHGALGL